MGSRGPACLRDLRWPLFCPRSKRRRRHLWSPRGMHLGPDDDPRVPACSIPRSFPGRWEVPRLLRPSLAARNRAHRRDEEQTASRIDGTCASMLQNHGLHQKCQQGLELAPPPQCSLTQAPSTHAFSNPHTANLSAPKPACSHWAATSLALPAERPRGSACPTGRRLTTPRLGGSLPETAFCV